MFTRNKLALAVTLAAGLAIPGIASATNGIMQAGNGMAAHGLGGAGVANANEAMSGYDNPALIDQTGDSVSMGFSMFMPYRAWNQAGTDTKSTDSMFAIPQIAFTSKLDDKMSWGVMVNAMGGMNSTYASGPNTGQPNFADPQSVNLAGLVIAPTLSYKVNNNVTVGASLLLGYETLRVINLFGSGLTDEGATMAYGVKFGATWKMSDSASFGAVLQPRMSASEFSFFKNFLGGMGFTGDAALVLPTTFGLGGKFNVNSKTDVVADLMYYQWSGVEAFDFFGWEDQTVLKAGVEHRPSDKLALRAGFNYGKSPIQGGTILPATGMDAAFANYPFPAVSEMHVTVGMGYKMDNKMTINAYYLYSPEAEENVAAAPISIKMTQHAFGIGINYQSK